MKNRRTVRVMLMLLIITISEAANAQATEKNIQFRDQLWFAYFNQTRFSNKWGMWLDVHYRQTGNFTERPFQFIFRPAITYFIADNVRVNAGYAFVALFPPAGLSTTRPEHRPWQQVWWSQKHTAFSTSQYLRLEERFQRKISNDDLQDGYDFNFRVRYNISFFIPLKGKEIAEGVPFAVVANELFVNFGKSIVYNTFDQNRLFLGIGYQFLPNMNAQFGYMNVWQQLASGSDYVSVHSIRLYVFHNIDWREKEGER